MFKGNLEYKTWQHHPGNWCENLTNSILSGTLPVSAVAFTYFQA